MGQARELMDKVTRAVMEGDLDALRDLYAPDVVATTPDAGELHGIDQVIAWHRGFVDAFSEMGYEMQKEYETENCAIDQGVVIAKHTGPLAAPDGTSFPATGKTLRLRGLDVAEVAGGKVIRHDFYYDQLDFMSQLGLLQAAPTVTHG